MTEFPENSLAESGNLVLIRASQFKGKMAAPLKEDKTPKEPDREFQKFLARKGLRATRARLNLYEACFRLREHFTAEELLRAARKRNRVISRATVYRTLPLLVESGAVKEIDIGKDYKFYIAAAGRPVAQAEVICLDCDKIYEIDAPFLEWYAQSIAAKVGLRAVSRRLQVRARCGQSGSCARIRSACPKNQAAHAHE